MNGPSIIFDLDGTLVDSIEAHYMAFAQVMSEMGVDVSRDEFKGHFGKLAKFIVRDQLRSKGIEKDLDECQKIADKKQNAFMDYVDLVKILPGVNEFLADMQAQDVSMSIASNSVRKVIDAILKQTGVGERIDIIISVEDVEKPKPDPMMLNMAARVMEVRPDECIVVEDSVYGLKAAKTAGMATLAVLTGGAQRKNMQDAGADMIVDTLEGIDADTVLSLTQ